MRRSGGLAAGLVTVVALLCAAAAASAEAASRYSFADSCQTLRVGGGAVNRSGLGYGVGGAAGQPFFMKASALGSYLLKGSDGKFLASGSIGPLGNGTLAASQAGPATDWALQESGNGFTLTNVGNGRALAVAGDGRLIQSTGQGAVFLPEAAADCASFPEIGLEASGTPWTGATPYGEVEGTIDAHNHVTAYEFLGGDAHCGEPRSRYGVEAALVDCPDHYPNGAGAVLENVLYGNPVRTHDPIGWPTFKDWPAPESLTHEQTYYRWIERAYLGGVRIMVNDLVENVALCDVYPIKHNSCQDMDSIRLQARRIHELEEYVDAQSGGPGLGWFRIVRSPFEARRVINEGKLAVVLGIETSEIFGCGGSEQQPRCDRAQIVRGLDEIEAMGVASLFPIHKFDNAFGGVRFDGGSFGVAINAANVKQTGQFWQIEPCTGPESDNEQTTAVPGEAGIIGTGLVGLLPKGATPLYPPAPHCNARGLTPLGEFLIEQMIDRGLMIELDHEGEKTAKRVLDIAEQHGYSGLIASHSWSDSHLWSRIYRLGGFAEPITSGAESFIAEWQQLRAASNPRFHFGIGFGADANGFHAQPSARGADKPSPVAYPFKSLDGRVSFDRQVSGQRTWDVNVDGVAQYGLHPDWMEQLRLLAGAPIADDLMNGAEAYLQTWERAVGVPGPHCLTPPKRLSPRGFGGLRLGRDPQQTLLAAGQPTHRVARTYRWCTSGRGKARGARRAGAAAVFGSGGQVEFVVSTVAGKGKPKRVKKLGPGLFVKRKGGGGDRIWGYRKGKLRFSAVATPRIARKAKLVKAALRESGLG
ncbi:MAG: Coagulation factor 5/8 type domain-containing protein [Thermoleophilia bacterium]|nr:Coagulation factor 5/8 type domain-containing protein [Thermoleophilia bacterium]